MASEKDHRDLKVKSSYASGAVLTGGALFEGISATGTLLSPPNSRDVQIEKFSIQAYGKLLVKDSDFSLINGRRYGLIAPNGSGKSTMLHAIACGLVPTPAALDYYLLDREFGPTEMTSLEAVLNINETEREALMDEMEDLLDDSVGNAERIDAIQDRLAELEVSGEERIALEILKGLGFSETLISTKTKDLSGGWRMRISLARILFVKPTLMMLDEPTNHLDLEAVVWLEEYLVHNLSGHTLLITCHSQDTLNEVCTDIIHLYHQKLDYYKGDYNTFTKVRHEKTALLTKQAMKEEKKMAAIQQNLNATGTKAQTQAKQKVKNMEKEKEKNKEKNKDLQEELIIDKEFTLRFGECGGGLPPPVLKFNDVSFGYDPAKPLFTGLNFGLDLDARIALVGPNGAGKSTLLKLMLGTLEPTSGTSVRHHHLRIGQFNQHMGDQLDMERSAVEWLCMHFKDIKPQEMRREVGKFGLTGKSQVIPMKQLSDGQRRRVLFCYLGLHTPHMFLMDEPTNALDLETIDALAEAINEYDGGVVFVTHDFRLIDQVAKEIWIVKDGTIQEFDGDIHDYKAALKAQYAKERAEAAAAAGLTTGVANVSLEKGASADKAATEKASAEKKDKKKDKKKAAKVIEEDDDVVVQDEEDSSKVEVEAAAPEKKKKEKKKRRGDD
ncbi:P-loop containing nucleoside triphosphate hydrolase protein [Obelidium mucronatum]|nr:P-loop containing nucleoside triphosphate hydrolase protein [Obelidium mucronatum]